MKTLLGWLLTVALVLSSTASNARTDELPLFSQAELDQMLAPVALYPDQLLSQILMAATYPLEVVQAARFQRSNPGLQGEEAVRAASAHDWDPSVQSLLAFPNVLQQMDTDLDWTERLGDAFLGQQEQVMDTVQALRSRAYAAGNLDTNEQVRVVHEREIIMVQPARSNLFYVPYYDPLTVYGSWWWPQYRPVSWGLWPGYELGFAYGNRGAFYWGSGISLGLNFFFGDWDWPTHRVRVVPRPPFYYRRPPPVHYVWAHDYRHRHGHPYRQQVVAHRYRPAHDARPVYRHDYRESPDRRYVPDARRTVAVHPKPAAPNVIRPPQAIRYRTVDRSAAATQEHRNGTPARIERRDAASQSRERRQYAASSSGQRLAPRASRPSDQRMEQATSQSPSFRQRQATTTTEHARQRTASRPPPVATAERTTTTTPMERRSFAATQRSTTPPVAGPGQSHQASAASDNRSGRMQQQYGNRADRGAVASGSRAPRTDMQHGFRDGGSAQPRGGPAGQAGQRGRGTHGRAF